MKFFSKKAQELDFRCWQCKKLLSHKNIKWKPRKIEITSLEDKEVTELFKEIGNKNKIASPNKVFGFEEYEYHGNCPNCNAIVNCLWFGRDSLNKNKTIPLELDQQIVCPNCNNRFVKEFQVLYSYRISVQKTEEQPKEVLVTVCPNCKEELSYPFEYDLDYGTIQ